jgi:hypothetical protein
MEILASFARRLNRDSSLDSICIRCFQTVATARTESALVVADQDHICNMNWASMAYCDSALQSTF